MSDLSQSMKRLNVTGNSGNNTSGYDTHGGERTSSGEHSGSGTGSGGPPQRKADLAYNHLVLAERPGICKASRSKLSVTSNYFILNAPSRLRYVTFRLEFETENPRRKGEWESVKKEKMTECFRKVWDEHRNLFPRKDAALVYNGTDMIYCPPDHKITQNYVMFKTNPKATFKGRPAKPNYGRMSIIPIGLSEISTVMVDDEVDRCAVMQFLDCIISQEHRFNLTKDEARFIQHGHSLFKIPSKDKREAQLDVIPIGKGEEVWLGLHAAVKCDSEELMLNADTSGSIFKSRGMSLIEFFAQVVKGYTMDLRGVNFENLTIDERNVNELAYVLKGQKLLMKHPNGTEKLKKFDGFSRFPADREFFNFEGREISIAEFFIRQYNHRLEFPKFPCLKFYNKITKQFSILPMELFFTLAEPTRFKGKLTDQQLDVFVKAVCQNPKAKKNRIERFCVAGGDYLGESAVMREWGVSIERKMVTIEDCPVLPVPHIEMNGSAPNVAVDSETGQWKITETGPNGEEKAVHPLEKNESIIVLAVIYLNNETRDSDKRNAELLRQTLTSYGLKVDPNVGTFQGFAAEQHGRTWQPNNTWLNRHYTTVNNHCANLEKDRKIKHIPLHVWVFPRRQSVAYAAIKYHSDVVFGVPSQCTVRKTFEKLAGNAVTNTSAQNLLLKILAKTGSVEFRLSSFAHKNIEKLQNPEDPVLVMGIDVSHPGRDERFDAIDKHEKKTGRTTEQANKFRGQHEKLPTARPVGKTLFKDIGYYDCPRSVVSVVGTTDIKGARYGVSSRVQRIGQEETVNMVDPFKERLLEFTESIGNKFPKHIILYRDGASDTQVKKIAYEELESLERACEAVGMEKGEYTVTYIMAAKRHHTRFFRANLDEMPANAPHLNCPPGTLVEQKIVSRNKWDFYLQSHYGTLGTALPTRYTVVRDDWKVSAAFIQTIVFAHCFGNVRCPRPLSIPVPLHYAHLAAKRSKILFDHYKESPSDEYLRSTEDLVREEIEKNAITPHRNIKEMKAMHYA